MTDRDRLAPTARRYYRRHAEAVERAGDGVGSNDMELANDLYALAGRLRAYADSFDPEELHEEMRVGTIVRVKNLENDSTVRVRINDRGPSDDNREEGVIIDLSRRAARKLGMMQDGRVRVQVDVLQWGDDKRE